MTSARPEAVWVLVPRRPGAFARIKECWHSRSLLRLFAHRSMEQIYKRTLLGWLWLVIRPLVPLLTMAVVFGALVGVDTGPIPYPVFLSAGLTCWNLFDGSWIWGTRGMYVNRKLIDKIYFPRLLVPVGSIAPGVVEFLVNLVFLVLVILFYWIARGTLYFVFGPQLLYAAWSLLCMLALAIGLALFTSLWDAQARDTRYTLKYILQVWIYACPIIYPTSSVPEAWRWLYFLNPLAAPIDNFRLAVLGQTDSILVMPMLVATGMILLVFSLGFAYFSRVEAEAVDRM